MGALALPTTPCGSARAATEASAAPPPAFRGCIGPGYCFMDSPGNDLESIAGQVASGCNLIYFSTGNGSITNFPFVPTIKIISTTRRYQLMKQDMDIDAGDQSKTPEERAENDAAFQPLVEAAVASFASSHLDPAPLGVRETQGYT